MHETILNCDICYFEIAIITARLTLQIAESRHICKIKQQKYAHMQNQIAESRYRCKIKQQKVGTYAKSNSRKQVQMQNQIVWLSSQTQQLKQQKVGIDAKSNSMAIKLNTTIKIAESRYSTAYKNQVSQIKSHLKCIEFQVLVSIQHTYTQRISKQL